MNNSYQIFFSFILFVFISNAQSDSPVLYKSIKYDVYEWKDFPIEDYDYKKSNDNFISYFFFYNEYLHIFYQGGDDTQINENSFITVELSNKKTRSNFVEYEFTNGSGSVYLQSKDGLLGIYDSKNELDIFTNLFEFPVNQVNDSEIPQIISNLPESAKNFLDKLKNTFAINNVLLYETFDNYSNYSDYQSDMSNDFSSGKKNNAYRIKVNRSSHGGGRSVHLKKNDSDEKFWISSTKDYDMELSFYLQKPSNSGIYIMFGLDSETFDSHVLLINKKNARYRTLVNNEWEAQKELETDLQVKNYNKVFIKKRGYEYYFYLGDTYLGYKRITSRFGGKFGLGLMVSDDNFSPYVDFQYVKITEIKD